MKQVTMESVKQRIQQLTKSAGRNDAYQISINEERELACLRELVAVTEQRDAVVVENVALKKVISDVQGIYYKSDGVAGYHLNGQIATWDEVMPDLWEIETPATDAARSSLRAEGVEWIEGAEPEKFGRYWVRYETDVGPQYCSAQWMEYNFCASSDTNIHKIWLADHSRSINQLRNVTHYTRLPEPIERGGK